MTDPFDTYETPFDRFDAPFDRFDRFDSAVTGQQCDYECRATPVYCWVCGIQHCPVCSPPCHWSSAGWVTRSPGELDGQDQSAWRRW